MLNMRAAQQDILFLAVCLSADIRKTPVTMKYGVCHNIHFNMQNGVNYRQRKASELERQRKRRGQAGRQTDRHLDEPVKHANCVITFF